MQRNPQEASSENGGRRSTLSLVQAVTDDARTLLGKQLELAKHEVTEALAARVKAAAAGAVGAVFGLVLLVFLGAAAANALGEAMSGWAAWLVVAGGYGLVAGGAFAFALMRAKRPLVPQETRRSVKEDVEWAKAQLKR